MARLVRFGKGLARDREIPRWAKGLLVFALLPLPGPLDEFAWVVVGAFLLLRHRAVVRRCWAASA